MRADSIASSTKAKEGYKHNPPFDSNFLRVSPIHRIHYQQYGRWDGKPVVFLHGGPGGRTSPSNTLFFDPEFYRVVLFDQRGSGQSQPAAELRENTSQDLVADIESLRTHLRISKWHIVFGGSWGSTLALLYAETYPEVVRSLVIRGIFTMRKSETSFARGFGGAARIFPELFDDFINHLPLEERTDPYPAYHKRLTSDDYQTRLAASKAWNKWELGISQLIPQADTFDALKDDTWCLQHARMEIHYESNGGFMEDGQLLKPENIERIKNIPCRSIAIRRSFVSRGLTCLVVGSIVQGRYDVVCPPKTAWDLHKALPNSKLFVIQDAGHSAKVSKLK